MITPCVCFTISLLHDLYWVSLTSTCIYIYKWAPSTIRQWLASCWWVWRMCSLGIWWVFALLATHMFYKDTTIKNHDTSQLLYYNMYYFQTGVIFSRQSFWVPTTVCYLQNWMFCPITLFQVVRFEKFLHKQWSFFWDDGFEYQNPMFSSNLNILSHNSIPTDQFRKLLSQTGVGSFFKAIILSTNNPMLSLKLNVFSHNSIPSGQIWKNSFTNRGQFFKMIVFEFQQPSIFFKIEHFIPYFHLSQNYLLYVYICHIFCFSSAILIALHDNLELTVLCRLWRLLQRLYGYMFLLTSIGQFHFLLWTLFFFFFDFFMCILDICSWGTNYTFLQLLPSKVFNHHMSTKVRSILGGQLWIQIHICVVPFECPLHHQLQSHLCLISDDVGGQLQIWIQVQIHICVVPFDGPLHHQLQSHLCLTLDYVVGQLQLQLQLQSHVCPTWADCGRRSTQEKSGVNFTFSVYRNLSATHDWIGALTLYGQ